jgi:DNA polymerase III epsilon subunit-like protein
MIILDIETTGTDPKRHCMLSLGAVDYETGAEFYGECRVYKASLIDPIALGINGFTEQEAKNPAMQFAYELYEKFLKWSEQFPDKLLAGHNIGHFDVLFLEEYHRLVNPEQKFPFGYRTLDLHSVAFAKLGRSLSHESICEALGLPKEPKPHNALAGARSERDAFKLLL